MNETFALYLLTRLDALVGISVSIAMISGFAYVILFFMDSQFVDKEFTNQRRLLMWMTILGVAGVMFIPSQKEAMFIVAGTGVIEAAKSDTAQRIAGKSVAVVEKYLDEALKDKPKDTPKEEKK